MGITARVEGNLTKNPTGRTVLVENVPTAIVEMRVFADVRRRVGDQWQQDDERSSAVDVTIWYEFLGKNVMDHLRTGSRVVVEGDLHLHEYDDKDGKHHASMRMTATSASLMLHRVEEVRFAARRTETSAELA